jgi:hypothetical protein
VFNIVFNLYNKSALNLFPFPWFMSTLQLACGVLFMCVMWLLRLQPLPKMPASFYIAVIPVAFFHTVGHVSACCAFSQMSVSFTHIVKAAEPVLSVMLAWPLMGTPHLPSPHLPSPHLPGLPAAERRHPTGRERMGSPTLQTLQDPILLLPLSRRLDVS